MPDFTFTVQCRLIERDKAAMAPDTSVNITFFTCYNRVLLHVLKDIQVHVCCTYMNTFSICKLILLYRVSLCCAYRFSRQAIRTALNSDLPLIFSEIRTLPSENDPITLFNSDIATPDSQSSSFSNTKVDWQLEGSSKGTGTDMNTVSERKSPKKSDSKLIDRGLPLSQLGFTLWGSEGTKVKCLRKRGYFTRSLPLELSSGYIGDFVMNSTMRSLYPSIRIVWQCGVGKEGGGKGRGILVLFRCPVSGSVYDLGAVSRRHLGSGEPTAWHCRDSGL